jgi:peptidyl-prolyl cis-trans isomerase D
MLSFFSKFAKSIWGKIFTGLIAVGMVAFGITNVITGLGGTTVAESGGQELSVRDFSRGYEDYLNFMSQRMGRTPNDQEAIALGIPGLVIQQFHTDAAVNLLASELGLGVTDKRLGELIQQDPRLGNVLGTFDRTGFKDALRQLGYTENEYLELRSRTVRREQLEAALFDDAPVPQAARDLITRFSGDKRSVDYFVLNAQSLPPVAEPTEEELTAYLAEHQADYRTVETRQIDLMALSPEALAAANQPTEDEVVAEYERTKASRTTPEQRTIQQIILTDPAQAQAFTDGQTAGTPLADLLAQTGLTPIDLGTLTRTQISDSALAEAAFGLPDTGFAIIEGIGGNQRVVAVTAITPAGETSLEDARADITRQLAMAAARAQYNDILDQIEELRAAFRPLPEIAERFGLTLNTVGLTATGAELAVLSDLPADQRTRISTRVFATEQGDLSPTVSLGSNYNVLFDLKEIQPARDRTLDEVRDELVVAWTTEMESEAVAAEVTKVLAELEAGTSFADAAVAANQFPQLTQPLGRSGDGGTIDATVATEIFKGAEGRSGSAVNAQGDHVVFQVVEIVPPAADAPDSAPAVAFVEKSTRDALYADFVAGVTRGVSLRVNDQVLSQVLGANTAAQ